MQTQLALSASNLLCTEADAIIFKEIEGSVISTLQKLFLSLSHHFVLFFTFAWLPLSIKSALKIVSGNFITAN